MSGSAVIGSAVIHWRTRASLVDASGHRSQHVALGQDPDQPAEVLDDDRARVLARHPLRDLPSVSSGATVMKFGETISARVPMARVYLAPKSAVGE